MINFLEKDREKVELISDDFQSTFSIASKNVLVNMLRTAEKEQIINILKKHLGNDISVRFQKTNQFEEDDGYDIYGIIVDAE